VSGAYYNEMDKHAAAWLRELIRRNLIAPGEVDERSIEDVTPNDIRHFTQCHFFAGIGGWSFALRIAGWSDHERVWTGSCPCQPFSAAGKGQGFADQRHLWPAWLHLVSQCGPPTLFGEQVASPDAMLWWDLVSADLEGQGYACAAADLAAAGVGAPHIRQRIFWVAESEHGRRQGREQARNWPGAAMSSGATGGLADGQVIRRGKERTDAGRFAVGNRAQGLAAGLGAGGCDLRADALDGFWSGADWLGCRDGKWRPVEPGTFPLAHGVPARVVRLRGYGNAIVPQLAAEFIRAAIECGVGGVGGEAMNTEAQAGAA
jgi:DNA (cytosine-5)-methyltransferase 1